MRGKRASCIEVSESAEIRPLDSLSHLDLSVSSQYHGCSFAIGNSFHNFHLR